MKYPSFLRATFFTGLSLSVLWTGPILLAAATDAAPAAPTTTAPATTTAATPATSATTTATAAAPAAATATVTAPPPPSPRNNPAIIPVPQAGANYQTVHQKFVAMAKQGGIDVMFLGDSITDFWTGASSGRATGKAVWDANFAPLKAANFGYNADKTQNVLWRLQNGEGQGFQPKVIVMMLGTNNTGVVRRGVANSPMRNTTAEAIEGDTAVITELRKDFPDAKILLLSVFPRGDDAVAMGQIPDLNQGLAKLDDGKHVFYLDISKVFLGPDGKIIPEAFGSDKLHPTAKGYQLWADAIKDPLAKLLK